MVPNPARLYKPDDNDRVAVVSAEPASSGGFLIRVARGSRSHHLKSSAIFGPFSAGELPLRWEEVLGQLRADGFIPPPLGDLLEATYRRSIALAALRLGWRRETAAVEPILSILPDAVDEVCSLIDALGMIGDPQALPALRSQAARKLLSRRRSAVEALRRLGDVEGVAEAMARAREQLPPPILLALEQAEAERRSEGLVQAVAALEDRLQGLCLDTLYEIGNSTAVEAVRLALKLPKLNAAYHWRYIKSILKRAWLRRDFATAGELTHAIEILGRSLPGTRASVKSGYDGKVRETRISHRNTRDYLRRDAWRYLRNLARHEPSVYPHAAAECLIQYGPEDAESPSKFSGAFARAYLLNRILWGSSSRIRFYPRSMRFAYRSAKDAVVPAGRDEVAFPELWESQPVAFLRILEAAKLPEAHAFALRAVTERHRAVLEMTPVERIIPLLAAPYEPTVRLGMSELERRFDPSKPDLALIDHLLSHPLDEARFLGRRWLAHSAPAWSAEEEWLVAFLAHEDPEVAAQAAELAADELRRNPTARRTLASRLLSLLRKPEASPGAHDAYARIARDCLLEDLQPLFNVRELVSLTAKGSPPAQALAGDLLANRPDALGELGLSGVEALADHPVATVRAAAIGLLEQAAAAFRSDPSLLFALAESEWADTRSGALSLLQRVVPFETMGFDGILSLLDSTREDVQQIGRELAIGHVDRIDPGLLANCLVEHPHRAIRGFALEMAWRYLPDGVESLSKLTPLLRSALIDLNPDRALKRSALHFLAERGVRDPHQAEVAAAELGHFARLACRADSEAALQALARIALAFPEVRNPLAVGEFG
ncbi:MAG: hypothetical protein U0800_25095 [Isosphaeraceae bacterium]